MPEETNSTQQTQPDGDHAGTVIWGPGAPGAPPPAPRELPRKTIPPGLVVLLGFEILSILYFLFLRVGMYREAYSHTPPFFEIVRHMSGVSAALFSLSILWYPPFCYYYMAG